MARQEGIVILNGTIAGITFYTREGKYLARKRTSLNKKRVKNDPAFKNSRAAGKKFGRAAKLAKKIYWQLPDEKRGQGIIGKLTGSATRLLKQGYTSGEIKQKLLEQFIGII